MCYIQKKRALSDSFFILVCGERGIRTPGASQLNGFQDRRNRPLCHLSSSECVCHIEFALRMRATIFLFLTWAHEALVIFL